MSETRLPRMLFVEDDPVIRRATADYLGRNGFDVVTAEDGDAGLLAWRSSEPVLALLDIMLPGMDGVSLCRAIRAESQIPVILMSARSDPIDVVMGLEAGADDYVTKPFEPAVLAARLRAALRRVASADEDRPAIIEVGPLVVDREGYTVTRDGEALPLTPTEYRLLVEFVDNVGMALDRPTLLERVWGYGWAGDTRLVDVHVQRLRSKIEVDPASPELVQTVRGVGYKLVRPSEDP
ncbi:MAG: response regulator transcription factor [Gaiellales bacterium]|jgi:DNA-binding response OmpR family regulator|nr:response regulator transcription factor [Gaiellales bacterium]